MLRKKGLIRQQLSICRLFIHHNLLPAFRGEHHRPKTFLPYPPQLSAARKRKEFEVSLCQFQHRLDETSAVYNTRPSLSSDSDEPAVIQ